MGSTVRHSPKGKHVLIDQNAPEAVGICDKSGFVFLKKDLVKQMEWRGNALVWTGFLVGRPYLDTPNEQLRPPILPPDPVPVELPRLPQGSTETFSNNTLPIISQIFLPINQIGNTQKGALSPTENQRLINLEQNNVVNLVSNGGPIFNEEPLNPNIALSNLQSARWMAP